jgi:hypothetical protein
VVLPNGFPVFLLLPFVRITSKVFDDSTVVENELPASRLCLHFRATLQPKDVEALQHVQHLLVLQPDNPEHAGMPISAGTM